LHRHWGRSTFDILKKMVLRSFVDANICCKGRMIPAFVGWVAMWRPLQIFLCDWWPLQRQIRLYLRLAVAHIQVVEGK